jgi:hypothetical protein
VRFVGCFPTCQASRSSLAHRRFRLKGKDLDVRRIADALGVTNVLEGSVRKAGNRIRVTAQLITAADSTHLWSERYDRELANVFVLQDEIAQAIAAALQLFLLREKPSHRLYTPTLPAYEAFLRARHHLDLLTPQSLSRGRELLEHAIELDPRFALPHLYLGEYFVSIAAPGRVPAADSMPQARRAAQTALAIDPNLPEAQTFLGLVAAVYDYDWDEAEQRFRAAMARSDPERVMHQLSDTSPARVPVGPQSAQVLMKARATGNCIRASRNSRYHAASGSSELDWRFSRDRVRRRSEIRLGSHGQQLHVSNLRRLRRIRLDKASAAPFRMGSPRNGRAMAGFFGGLKRRGDRESCACFNGPSC